MLVLFTGMGLNAQDRSANPSAGLGSSLSATQQRDASGDGSVGFVFREGTSVVETIGRVARVGPRWQFRPESSSGGMELGMAAMDAAPPPQRPQRTTNSVLDQSPFDDKTPLGTERTRTSNIQPHQLPKLLVLENLMLSRIVRAIEEDPRDDKWIITGEVTEFLGENRLMILSAKRYVNQGRSSTDGNERL
ncbi:MAG: hypothetical protein AAGD07_06530 [Planctomycetota bacterium]